jgi:hypothetical protein
LYVAQISRQLKRIALFLYFDKIGTSTKKSVNQYKAKLHTVGANFARQNVNRVWLEKKKQHTVGVEFGAKVVSVGGKSVRLQIWDTAGQVCNDDNFFFQRIYPKTLLYTLNAHAA